MHDKTFGFLTRYFGQDPLSFFRGNLTFTSEDLELIPDSGNAIVPRGCKIEQLVVQDHSGLALPTIFLQNYPIMMKMPKFDRAFTILHELLYYLAVKNGAKDSLRVRRLVQDLADTRVVYTSPAAVLERLARAAVPIFLWDRLWSVQSTEYGFVLSSPGSPVSVESISSYYKKLTESRENPVFLNKSVEEAVAMILKDELRETGHDEDRKALVSQLEARTAKIVLDAKLRMIDGFFKYSGSEGGEWIRFQIDSQGIGRRKSIRYESR